MFPFFSGVIAERSDLRTFLTVGLLLTGYKEKLNSMQQKKDKKEWRFINYIGFPLPYSG